LVFGFGFISVGFSWWFIGVLRRGGEGRWWLEIITIVEFGCGGCGGDGEVAREEEYGG
jgi:hypothetical protein